MDNDNDNDNEDNNNKNEEDEEEEEDEDYDPTADPENNDNNDDEDDMNIENTNDDNNANNFTLSVYQNKAVEDAFTSLFQHSNNLDCTEVGDEVKHSIPPAANKKSSSLTKKQKKKEKRKLKIAFKKKKRILSDLFGAKVATKMLLRNHEYNLRNKHNNDAATLLSTNTIARLERKVITETKSFAGQEISIQKVVMEPVVNSTTADNNSASAASATNTKPIEIQKATNNSNHLDCIISNMENDKNKISTIEKSNVDWETYKEKTNLNNEEFEKKAAQGDGSYLNKKEFLQRVDVRRFEHEKDERDRKRVANS